MFKAKCGGFQTGSTQRVSHYICCIFTAHQEYPEHPLCANANCGSETAEQARGKRTTDPDTAHIHTHMSHCFFMSSDVQKNPPQTCLTMYFFWWVLSNVLFSLLKAHKINDWGHGGKVMINNLNFDLKSLPAKWKWDQAADHETTKPPNQECLPARLSASVKPRIGYFLTQ